MAAAPAELILRTKIQIPRVQPQRVMRSRLQSRLEPAGWRRLTLVCAPAGFGKTTLLAGWAGQASFPVAWLALDEADNAPERFLRYLLAAFDRACPGLGTSAASMLGAPQALDAGLVVATLINELADRQEMVGLVLDDYHLIHAAAVLSIVAQLVENVPDSLRLVIASRADPDLPLARLRARGELLEVRGADLRFQTAEAAEFLNQVMGLDLTPQQVAALEARTEGWIAGLQLAALSMRERQEVDDFIQVFTGTHRFILDYLVDEVLQRQPDAVRQFLVQTAILDRLAAPLCAAVTGLSEPAAAEMLAQLEHSNLFIQSLDDERRWYRYHRLFADLLRLRLGELEPETVVDLHRRAAAWLQGQNLPAESVPHWIQAGDFEQAGQAAQDNAENLLVQSRANQLMGWLDLQPEALFTANPHLHLAYSYALTSLNQFGPVEKRLLQAEQLLPNLAARSPHHAAQARIYQAEITAMRAILASVVGDLPRTIELSNQALPELPEDMSMRSSLLMSQGVAYRFTGQLRQAERAFAESAAAMNNPGLATVLLTVSCNRADVLMELGELAQAETIYHQAIQLADGSHSYLLPQTSLALTGLSEVQYQRNQLDAALQSIQTAVERSQLWGNLHIHMINLHRLGVIQVARGEFSAAGQALQLGAETQAGQVIPPLLQMGIEYCQVAYQLALGQWDDVWQWYQQHPYQPGRSLDYLSANSQLMQARVLLAVGRARSNRDLVGQAAEALQTLLPVLEQLELGTWRTHALCLLAAALHNLRQTEPAVEALRSAAAAAALGGQRRCFVEGGPEIADLLRCAPDLAADNPWLPVLIAEPALVPVRVHANGGSAGPTDLPEPLSEREVEVLRLVALGLSNQEIAARLILAPGTVKRHLHNILGKLDAGNRTEAIARARQVGLLD